MSWDDGTEAEFISHSQYDDDGSDYVKTDLSTWSNVSLRDISDKRQILSRKYDKNKSKKLREECKCPICGRKFLKKTVQQAFDNTKCKDKYWNYVSPKRFQRCLTRSS
jgi:hypothetical protein